MYTFVCSIKLELNLIVKFHTANCVYHHSHHIRIHSTPSHAQNVINNAVCTCVHQTQSTCTHTNSFTHKTHAKHTHTHTLCFKLVCRIQTLATSAVFYALIIFSWCNSMYQLHQVSIMGLAIVWTPGSMHEC